MAQTKKPLVFRDRNTKEKIPYYVKTEDVQLPDGTDIETKLAEMEEALDGAADGTVKSVTLNNVTVEPDANGDVDLGEIEQAEQKQADWSETDTTDPAYIKHKPTKLSDFTNDEGFTDNAGTVTGVKMNDGNAATPDSNGVVDLGTVITSHQSLAALFGRVAYDGTTHRINFYGKDDVSMTTVLGYIDCSPFIVDGMLSNVEVKNVTINNVSTPCMVFSFNTDAGKQNINIPVSSIFNAANYYTKDDADGRFQLKLVSGTNIKTVNNTSILGEGNITIPAGESAYDIAVDEGFEGTEAQWLASLKGDKGDQGDTVVLDTEGLPLFKVVNDLTTGGEEDALSAEMGKSIGQFLGKLLNAKDSTFYNVWVGTAAELEALDGDYDDNTIYLVGTVATVAQRFNVSFDGGDHTSIPANTPETVKEGSAFSVVVSPASGYTIDTATGTMVGGSLTKTTNQNGTVTFSTSSVTGAITIQAAATIHITGITVSAGTRTNNSIPLTAVVAPSGAENVTLAWSISEDGTNWSDSTTNFGISGSGTNATLTIKSGASSSSVSIKCADTNASSGTAQGTLQLTGLTYEETPILIEGITDITSTRTAANTRRLEAVINPADANTPTVSFSLVGNVPTVKQVRRWAAGDTVDGEVKESAGNDLIELPAVELSGDTLTYKGDCQVQVKATAGSVESDVKTIDIVHDNADAIWFEDSEVLSLLNTKGIGSGGKITYTQAAAVTTFSVNNVQIFEGNTDIVRFNEFKHFTSITSIGMGASHKSRFNGCINLEAIELSNTLGSLFGSSNTSAPFKGTKIKKLVVTKSGATISQYSLSGMVLEELEATPSSITQGFANGTTTIKKITIKNTGSSPFVAKNFENFSNLEEVDLGTGIGALASQLFRGCTSLNKLTLRYDGVVTSDNAFYNGASLSSIDLYVPSDQVETYKSTSPWSGFKTGDTYHIYAITD